MSQRRPGSIRLYSLLLLTVTLALSSCSQHESGSHSATVSPTLKAAGTATTSQPTSPSPSNINYLLGNPSKATNSPSNQNDYLMEKPQYVLSFNSGKGGPNWVCWHLTKSDIGDAQRANDFRPDADLPSGLVRVTPNDYTHSGFDRGHMCNSKDRTSTPENNSATFLMTNMLPQYHDLNAGPWEKLETEERNLASAGNELYIIAGCRGEASRIGDGKVNVPTHCWKIIVVLPEGENDISRINANTRVIAVDMPNVTGIIHDDWKKAEYSTTVGAIEQNTGYHFFASLPPNIQAALKTKRDSQ